MFTMIGWLLAGLIAGFIGSKIVNKSGSGLIMDTLIGVVGAAVGGWLFSHFLNINIESGLHLKTIAVATVGSIVLLLIWRAVKSATA